MQYSVDTSSPNDRVGTLIAGRYEILELIGIGGMGQVYRARDVALGELVAVKLLSREISNAAGILERFRQEVKLARRVTHKNVARVFDIGESGADTFLTMELIDGESLGQRLTREGPIGELELAAMAVQVCRGLAAAHAAGVIHRDLKPDNILVGNDGRVVVTDFGIASALIGNEPSFPVGLVAGTPEYMAPEQVEGRTDVDARADIYALGASLFELATGHPPWTGSNAIATAAARLQADPPDPRIHRPAMSQTLAEAILRCMARAPAQRYATTTELARVLVALAPPRPIAAGDSARRLSPSVQPRRWNKTLAIVVEPLGPSTSDLGFASGLAGLLEVMLGSGDDLRIVAEPSKAPGSPNAGGAPLVARVTLSSRDTGIAASVEVRSVADGIVVLRQTAHAHRSQLFVLAGELAKAIGRTLALAPRPALPPGPRDPALVELWSLARTAARAHRSEHLDLAVALFEEACATNHEDVWINAGYAATLVERFRTDETTSSDLFEAIAMAERALRSTEVLGEPWLARGIATLELGDPAAAAPDLARALVAMPVYAPAHVARAILLLETGASTRAIARLERALELDPGYDAARTTYAVALALAGRIRESTLVIDAALAASNTATVWLAAARLCVWRRDDRAARTLAEAARKMPPFARRDRVLAVLDAVVSGNTNAARAAYVEILARDPSARRRRAQSSAAIAELAALTFDMAAAIDAIDDAVTEPGFVDVMWLDGCPLFAPIRSSARFQALRALAEQQARVVLTTLDETRESE